MKINTTGKRIAPGLRRSRFYLIGRNNWHQLMSQEATQEQNVMKLLRYNSIRLGAISLCEYFITKCKDNIKYKAVDCNNCFHY